MPSRRIEDYLEAIYILIRMKGSARGTEVAKMLGVSAPSVTEMFGKLKKEGYINHEKYSGATLTKKGEVVAKDTMTRHNVLKEFLLLLGVEESIAEKDACLIEHNVSPETMVRLTKFVDFAQQSHHDPLWLDHFKHYFETGERQAS